MASEDPAFGRHLAALIANRDEIWQQMLSAIKCEERAYTRFSTSDAEEEWARGVLQIFDLFLRVAREARTELTPQEIDSIRATGGLRADQGFDFPAVRASVRAAVGVVRSYIIEQYQSSPDPGAAMRRGFEFLEWFGNVIEDLLHEGIELRVRARAERSGKELVRLLRELEAGQIPNEDAFLGRVEALGCDPALPRGGLLLADNRAGDLAVTIIKTQVPGSTVVRRPDAEQPHLLVLFSVPFAEAWAALMATLEQLVRSASTTAIAMAPCSSVGEYRDRYTAARVLVPYLGRLSEGRPILDCRELVAFSVVAAAPPALRQWLRRDVLKGVESANKVFDFLALSVRHNFALNAIERHTGQDIKTVRLRREELEAATTRHYADCGDRVVLTLGYCAARLDG